MQILPRLMPMREDPPFPLTPEGATAKLQTEAERRALGLSDQPLTVPPMAVLACEEEQRHKVLDFPHLPSTASWLADRALVLQLTETNQAEHVASDIAQRVYHKDISELTAEQRVTLRYVAVGAVRSLSENWRREARKREEDAVYNALKHEGGAQFTKWPDGRLRAVAKLLATSARVARLGTLEGSRPMGPADYLRVADEDQQ
jgi:hypothetical protein